MLVFCASVFATKIRTQRDLSVCCKQRWVQSIYRIYASQRNLDFQGFRREFPGKLGCALVCALRVGYVVHTTKIMS